MNVYVAGKDVKTTVLIVDGLNEEFIIGMTLIGAQKLHWNPDSRQFGWGTAPLWHKGHGKTRATVKLAALTCTTVPVQMNTECGLVPSSGMACIANIGLIDNPYVTGGPYLIEPDKHGIAYVPMFNCAPYDIELQRNEFVAVIENVKGCSYEEVNPAYINSLSEKHQETRTKQKLTEAKKKLIEEKFCSDVPAEYKQQYLDVLLRYHEAISEDRFDLGRCRTDLHEITLRTDEPIFVKQFKIPDAHMEEVEKHVVEWLKLGVIEPAWSKHNSPIFAVAKKNGRIRLVQDFRALNAETHIDKYCMRDVTECVGEIG